MPTSIVVAIAASVGGAAIATGFGLVVGTLAYAVVSGISGAVIGGVLGGVLRGNSGSDDRGTPAITQEGRLLTVRQAAAPWQIIYGERKVGGTFTFIEVSTDNQYLHLVITYAGHVCNQIGDIYFDDEVVPLDGSGEATGKYAGYVRIKKSLGDEGDVQPFPDLQTESAGKWTASHKQRGRTKIYVRLTANPDLFPGGTPNITAVIQGKKVYDPRTALTAYSANAALCVNDYLTDTTFGIGATYATEIDETALTAAANLCDEDVSLASGGTEDRYRVGGAFDVSVQPREVMGRMLAAMAGHAVNVGGKWFVYGGAHEAPTVSLDEGDLAGAIRVQSLVSRRENANGVKGVFADPNSHWQVTDFPALGSATYMAEDGGQRVWKDLDFSAFVTSGTQAQRLSKIQLLSLRQGLAVVGQFKLTAYQAVTGRTVALSNTKFGWSSKAFKVDSARFTVNDDGTLGVELGLRETAAAVYDWSSTEEQTVDVAPNTNLPDPGTVETPTGLSIASDDAELIIGGDGTVISRMRVTWSVTDYNVIAGGRVLAQYKRATDTDYTDAGVVPGNATQLYISAVEDGTLYDVRVRFENVIGVKGAYASTQHTVVGKTEPPSDVEWFVIDGDTLSWGAVPDVDLAGYRIRFQFGSNQSWGDANPLHIGLVVASPFTMLPRPNGSVTIMIKAVDTVGNESDLPAVIVTDLGDAPVANLVETIDLRALGFPGDRINGTVDGSGNLVADDASGLFWNPNAAAAMWTYGSSLMWHATTYKDMYYIAQILPGQAGAGSQLTLSHSIVAGSYAVEYRRNGPGPMWTQDSETMWHVDDSALLWSVPPGDFPSSMWSGDSNLMWKADANALMWNVLQGGYQIWPGSITVFNEPYDIRISTSQGPIQGAVNSLTFSIDLPDIIERFNDVVISAGGTRLTLTETYRVIKNVLITVQNDGNGAVGARIEDKSPTVGPLVKTINDSGAAVVGLIDATIQGY